jgi:protein-L-isoaspartate(D-aspartate) O-methyltransferase
MMENSENLTTLINEMLVSGVLKSENIIDAFRLVDRKHFVPQRVLEYAYIDAPLSIGNDQTISQPSTVAFMLELLGVHEGDKVLDIGSGSGWTTALLCHLVGEKGSVIGVERVDELVKLGQNNLKPFNRHGHCHIQKAGDALGIPGEHFDRILVSASAEEIPQSLFDQLKVGGIMVIPIRESIYKFEKISEDNIRQEAFYGFRFVPLIYEPT